MSDHVWNNIPLADYERHMAHPETGQLSLLSRLTKKYYDLLRPATVLIPGVAGGNGLEHIDNAITKRVLGIDVNRVYLDAVHQRFSGRVAGLELAQADISRQAGPFIKAGFIWAALILEYTGLQPFFNFVNNNISIPGHLLVTIQSNNGISTVSATGVDSVKAAAALFRLVDPDALIAIAIQEGFTEAGFEENFLPDGKSFKTWHFTKY